MAVPSGYSDWCRREGVNPYHPAEWSPLKRDAYMLWKRARFRSRWRWLLSLGMPALIRQQSGREYLLRMVRTELREALSPPPNDSPWRRTACPCHPRRYRTAFVTTQEYWEDVTEAEREAWVAEEPFVRAGMSKRTQQAMTYLTTFDPAALAP
jgi:hypothetical protein